MKKRQKKKETQEATKNEKLEDKSKDDKTEPRKQSQTENSERPPAKSTALMLIRRNSSKMFKSIRTRSLGLMKDLARELLHPGKNEDKPPMERRHTSAPAMRRTSSILHIFKKPKPEKDPQPKSPDDEEEVVEEKEGKEEIPFTETLTEPPKDETLVAFDSLIDDLNFGMETCAGCKEVILPSEKMDSKVIYKQFWHSACFACKTCQLPLLHEQSFEGLDGYAYCQDHFEEKFPRCPTCLVRVAAGPQSIESANQRYHSSCFNCHTCKKTLLFTQSFIHEGGVYCELHYYQIFGMLCMECQLPIYGGECIFTHGLRYHVDHFLCAYCKTPLSTDGHEAHKGKTYCKKCYLALF